METKAITLGQAKLKELAKKSCVKKVYESDGNTIKEIQRNEKGRLVTYLADAAKGGK